MAKDKEKLSKLKHYCYLITNTVNGKVYVGTTYKDINDRFKEHIKVSNYSDDSKKQAIHRALVKHGVDNFTVELLSEYDNADLAYAAEIKYIAQLRSTNKKYGYNQSLGGDRGPIIIQHTRELVISVLTDFCDGTSLNGIVDKNKIPYHSVFDITRLRVSALHEIPQDLLDRLEEVKHSSNKRKRVDTATIVGIITKFVEGYTMDDISKSHRLSVNNVWNIIHRNTWGKVDIGNDLELKLKEKLSTARYWRKHGQQ